MLIQLQEHLLKQAIRALVKEAIDLSGVDISSVSDEEAKKIGERLNVDWDKCSFEQFKKGLEVEYEHTSDPAEAGRIALDHLRELPDYYTKLNKMEKEGDTEKEVKAIVENVLDKMGKRKVAKNMRRNFIGGGVYTEFPSDREAKVVKAVSKNLHRKPYSHNPPTAPIGSEPKKKVK